MKTSRRRWTCYASAVIVVLSLLLPGSSLSEESAKPGPAPAPSSQERTIALDYRSVDLKSLVDALGRDLGRSFVYDERLEGIVTVVSDVAVPTEIATDALGFALDAKGFETRPGPGGAFTIRPLERFGFDQLREEIDELGMASVMDGLATTRVSSPCLPSRDVEALWLRVDGRTAALTEARQVDGALARLDAALRGAAKIDTSERAFDIDLRNASFDAMLGAFTQMVDRPLVYALDRKRIRVTLTSDAAWSAARLEPVLRTMLELSDLKITPGAKGALTIAPARESVESLDIDQSQRPGAPFEPRTCAEYRRCWPWLSARVWDLGIRPGDHIAAVNGVPLVQMRGGASAFVASLRAGSTARVEIYDCEERSRTIGVPVDQILELFANLGVPRAR